MIKNFDQFKKDFNKDLTKLAKVRDEVKGVERDMDSKYQADLTKAIKSMLNALSSKYEFTSMIDFLMDNKIPDSEDMADMLREIEVNYYGNYYIISDIVKGSDDWKLKLNISEYNEDEIYIGYVRSETLYEILNILLRYTSGVLNAELYKNINK